MNCVADVINDFAMRMEVYVKCRLNGFLGKWKQQLIATGYSWFAKESFSMILKLAQSQISKVLIELSWELFRENVKMAHDRDTNWKKMLES
jgi:hypothetical protein